MNKNIIIILAIFIVPLAAYFGLTRDRLTTPPTVAAQNSPEVIKFYSPMCYECQELNKVFEEVFPQFENNIHLRKTDVTQNDSQTKDLIKKYNVKLVPTTVFKTRSGEVKRRIEGSMPADTLKNYLREITNG